MTDHVDAGAQVNLYESLATLRRNEHVYGGMLKLRTDLDRYHTIIEATKPELIVETGTCEGGSAKFFASYCDVITIDVNRVELNDPRVRVITGDSANPDVIDRVTRLVNGRRTMVSLDSDHSTRHVEAEIQAYGPLVSVGCYLVVEDGILHYIGDEDRRIHGLDGMVGSPIPAIGRNLVTDPRWRRDRSIENAYPTTHHLAGWWQRVAG